MEKYLHQIKLCIPLGKSVFLQQMEKMVEWLQNAEEESSEEEEDEEEEEEEK